MKVKCVKCDGTSLKTGDVYEVLSEAGGCYQIKHPITGNTQSFSKNRFVVVADEESILKRIQDDIDYAEGLLYEQSNGKPIKNNDKVYIYNASVHVVIGNNGRNNYSYSVEQSLREHGYCVYFKYGMTRDASDSHSSPVRNFNTTVSEVTMKLNDNYDVTIMEGEIVVGCQTIPIQKVRDILKAHDTNFNK